MEHIIGTAFINSEELSAQQLRDLHDAVDATSAFWLAAQKDPTYQRRHLRPHGRCIYAALSVVDILHALGRTDACTFKTGLDIRMRTDNEFLPTQILTIGHPGITFVSRLWNAHLVVRLGDILIDPSFAQMQRNWNDLPHFAAFLIGAPAGHKVELNGFGTAPTTTVHRSSRNGRSYQISYFQLPRNLDLSTRGWRFAGDARVEIRMSVVRRAIDIRHSQIADAEQRQAV